MGLALRRWLIALLCLVSTLTALSATPAGAQQWPVRQVKLITPLPPGTGIDVTARIYADLLAKHWGQPVVVENRVGAEGIVAVASFVAANDDHALLASIAAPFTIAPLTSAKLPYDPRTDVTPIAIIGETYLAIGASPALKAKSLSELAELARREPGKLVWSATTGLPQFAFSSFVRKAGLDMANPTYRDTASPLNDLAEGRLHIYVTGYAPLKGLEQAGKIRLLAVLGRDRFPVTPDVPTVVEAGFPHMVVNGFTGLFGWKDMPAGLRDRIFTDVRAATSKDPSLSKRFLDAALALKVSPAAELTALMDEQRAMVAEALKLSAPEKR